MATTLWKMIFTPKIHPNKVLKTTVLIVALLYIAPLDAFTTNYGNTFMAKCDKILTKRRELTCCNYNSLVCRQHKNDKMLVLVAVVNVVVKVVPNVMPGALVKL